MSREQAIKAERALEQARPEHETKVTKDWSCSRCSQQRRKRVETLRRAARVVATWEA